MSEDISQVMRASLERVSLKVKDELITLLELLYPGTSVGAFPRLNDSIADVARAYHRVASELLASANQDTLQGSKGRDRQPDQLPGVPLQSNGGEQPVAASKPALQNGITDKPSSAGPGTPPARSLSGPLSSTSPPAGTASAGHDVTPLEELLDKVCMEGQYQAQRSEGTNNPSMQAANHTSPDFQQQPQFSGTLGLLTTEPASGASSTGSVSQFSEEMAQLLRGLAPPQSGMDPSKPQMKSPRAAGNAAAAQQTRSPASNEMLNASSNPADPADRGSGNSESAWGSQTPLDAFIRAQQANSQLMHQNSNTFSVESDPQATGSGHFGRYVSASASASTSFLKSVHAALTSGNLGRSADSSSERPMALTGVAGDGRNSGRLPPAVPARGSLLQTGSQTGLMVVGTGDSQQEGRGYGQVPSPAGSINLGSEAGRSAALSASLVAQHNMLQQAAAQQQQVNQQQAQQQQLQQVQLQHQAQQQQLANQQLQQQANQQQQLQQQFMYQQQQEKLQQQQQQLLLAHEQQEKLQQQQQQLLLAHEQQRLAHELQLEQLNSSGLVQYTDARNLLGGGQQISYQVDPMTGNMVAIMPSNENGDVYGRTTMHPSQTVTFAQLGQQDRVGNFSQQEPDFSLFDLQPANQGLGGGYLPNSALSMFATANGNRLYKAPSPTGNSNQPLDLQAHPTYTSGLNTFLGSNGQLNSLITGPASSPVVGHTLSLGQMPVSSAGNSAPLPMVMGLGDGGYGTMISGYGQGANPVSNPDLAYLSNRLLNGGGSGNIAGLLTIGGGNATTMSPGEMPGRFKVLPVAVQQRIMSLCRSNPVITIRDFDEKVVSKLSLLVDSWGTDQALAMLEHLEHRMRTKQGAMKNGPGYLDVAVCSHLDMLKAQGTCPKSMKLDEYAQQVLAPPVFHELCEAVGGNRWLAWEHFDQGIIQLIKRLPTEGAVEKLQEITYHSFKNVDNIKGCIMSILNSKIREDRRRQ